MSTDGEEELNTSWTKSQGKEIDNKRWAGTELRSTRN